MPDLFGQPTASEALLRDAVLSPCGLYRYRLTRTWDAALRPACWIMLNPSTADAQNDDPTIRRVVGFARAWGCGGIVVVNLFAYRATDPKALFDVFYCRQIAPGRFHNGDPVGPDNDRHILDAAGRCRPVVAAWGVHGVMMLRDQQVRRLLAGAGAELSCLGLTKEGHPRHPLYAPGNCVPVPFSAEARR